MLEPILGIKDQKQMICVYGTRVKRIRKKGSRGYGSGISMYPTSMEELFAVSDAGTLMPKPLGLSKTEVACLSIRFRELGLLINYINTVCARQCNNSSPPTLSRCFSSTSGELQ